ncbi:lasso peptide biosynthesis B2 protein [Pseudomonas sp. Hp2]|uniref:lasso peptide biosynthesis B2 protein n=1 Tax=Pseudomonas sp. Hp2 TaxID=701189 RepID=UPI001127DB8C|nr:lasso peptide biosynthesis B2 protein [Pseudomonas sp. Hp2]
MARLGLHRDISYCQVEDRLIFLDIQNDRYFRLSARMESAFARYVEEGDDSATGIRDLVARQILVDGPGHDTPVPILSVGLPTRSAMEVDAPVGRTGSITVLYTIGIVCLTHLQLKTRRLKHVLDEVALYRERNAPSSPGASHREESLLAAAAAFRSVRPYVPLDTCCLPDSIAMVRFLAKRGFHAQLVFGVTGEPFSAHCWVQHDAIVLNDTVGHAAAHTPIRVI